MALECGEREREINDGTNTKNGILGSTVKPAHPNTPPGLEHIMEDLSSICMEIKRFLSMFSVPSPMNYFPAKCAWFILCLVGVALVVL